MDVTDLWNKSVVGHPKKFPEPAHLWNAAIDYFDWCKANPIMKPQIFQGEPVEIEKPRAFTISGLAAHAGISRRRLYDYREYEGFGDVFSAIEDIMYEQKLTNGMAETMNPMLVARDLKLSDSKELSGPDGAPLQTNHTGSFTFVGVGPDTDLDE